MNRTPWPRPRIHETKAGLSLARIVPKRKTKVQVMERNYVGIDIAAATFTAAWQTDTDWQHYTFEQTPAAYERLAHHLRQCAAPAHTRVVLEVTGTYWLALAKFLYVAGFVVSVVNPSQANLFARLELQRTKTDVLDAQSLAEFARQRQPAPWTPPPVIYNQLQQRLSQREALLNMKTQETNRLHALQHNPHADPVVQARTEHHIAYLQTEIQALEQELTELLFNTSHAWTTAAQRLLTIPGIGLIAAAWILTATQNFAHCATPEQAAAFAGLVPHRQESGTSRRGYRAVGRGGHRALRQTMYMAALSAARFNPCIKPFYDCLIQRGKPNKVARVAAARKLLHIAWAVVVKERDFDPSFAPRPALAVTGA